MFGMPERYIATPPSDHSLSIAMSQLDSESESSKSMVIDINDTLVLRTIYPTIADKTSCVNCHNEIQSPPIPWKIGDIMGAYVVDRGVQQMHNKDIFAGTLVGFFSV